MFGFNKGPVKSWHYFGGKIDGRFTGTERRQYLHQSMLNLKISTLNERSRTKIVEPKILKNKINFVVLQLVSIFWEIPSMTPICDNFEAYFLNVHNLQGGVSPQCFMLSFFSLKSFFRLISNLIFYGLIAGKNRACIGIWSLSNINS